MNGHAVRGWLAKPGLQLAFDPAAPARQGSRCRQLRLPVQPVLEPLARALLALGRLQGQVLQSRVHRLDRPGQGGRQLALTAAAVLRFHGAQGLTPLVARRPGRQVVHLLQGRVRGEPVAVAHHLKRQLSAVAQHLGVVVPPEPLGSPSIHSGHGLIPSHQRHHHFGGITHRQQQLQGDVQGLAGLRPQR